MMRFIRGAMVSMACLGLLSAQFAQAAAPMVRDVALQGAGQLDGQVLDTQGKPRAGIQVAAKRQGETLAVTYTDRDGRFRISELRSGIYELHAAQSVHVYRAWAPHTVPPVAQPGVLLVTGDEVVRGYANAGQHLGWMANPWCLGAIVAAAIAIPLAVDDSDGDSGTLPPAS